ncbi:hypothetical protein BJ170DRAFT_407539 [Xylariales sp. AK1849]|nr:hypothetical protein BJ170DRAFT_407539 [Xylariales sp. AK1849]
MSHTPQNLSPVKESASQDDFLGSEVIVDMPMHDGEEDQVMSDEMSPQHTQVKEQTREDITEDVRRYQTRTPEPKERQSRRLQVQPSPSTPGSKLVPFDWEDFEARYQKALADADHQESQLLEEFEQVVKYFNVWASASSSHDNERAVKRLQTRTRYVHLSEEKLKQKKQHLTEVVKAFQSALALLSAA